MEASDGWFIYDSLMHDTIGYNYLLPFCLSFTGATPVHKKCNDLYVIVIDIIISLRLLKAEKKMRRKQILKRPYRSLLFGFDLQKYIYLNFKIE